MKGWIRGVGFSIRCLSYGRPDSVGQKNAPRAVSAGHFPFSVEAPSASPWRRPRAPSGRSGPFAASGFWASCENANPGGATCSRKPLSSAGMSRSHSGKNSQVLSPIDRILRRGQIRRQLALLPFVLAAQQRKIERRHVDAPDLVARRACASGIRVLQRVAQMTLAGIRMALNQENVFAHAAPRREWMEGKRSV